MKCYVGKWTFEVFKIWRLLEVLEAAQDFLHLKEFVFFLLLLFNASATGKNQVWFCPGRQWREAKKSDTTIRGFRSAGGHAE